MNSTNMFQTYIGSVLDSNIPVTAVSPMSYMQQPNIWINIYIILCYSIHGDWGEESSQIVSWGEES